MSESAKRLCHCHNNASPLQPHHTTASSLEIQLYMRVIQNIRIPHVHLGTSYACLGGHVLAPTTYVALLNTVRCTKPPGQQPAHAYTQPRSVAAATAAASEHAQAGQRYEAQRASNACKLLLSKVETQTIAIYSNKTEPANAAAAAAAPTTAPAATAAAVQPRPTASSSEAIGTSPRRRFVRCCSRRCCCSSIFLVNTDPMTAICGL